MLRFKVQLGRYAGYFDYYVENGVMPESYSLDPLADYLQEVLNEPSNKYLCMIDTNWRESIKRSLLDFFEQMLKQYVPIDTEYDKEMKLLQKFEEADIDTKRQMWPEVVRTIATNYSDEDVNLKGYKFMLQDPTFDNELVFKMMCGDWRTAAEKGLQRTKKKLLGINKGSFEKRMRDYGSEDYLTLKDKMSAFYRYPKLKEIVHKLGREQETSTKEEDSIKYRYLPFLLSHGVSHEDIEGIELGNDLQSVIPAEIALLADNETETLFYQRYASKQLQQFSSRPLSKKPVKTVEKELRPRLELGPIILCVDTSGSMSGRPEAIAKSLVMQVLQMAKKQHRRCFLISYSVRTRTLELTSSENWRAVDQFLAMQFTGGTDGELMFRDVMRALGTENFEMADVLLVSDFCFSNPMSITLDKIKAEKRKGTRFYGLCISGNSCYCPEIIDHMWELK